MNFLYSLIPFEKKMLGSGTIEKKEFLKLCCYCKKNYKNFVNRWKYTPAVGSSCKANTNWNLQLQTIYGPISKH